MMSLLNIILFTLIKSENRVVLFPPFMVLFQLHLRIRMYFLHYLLPRHLTYPRFNLPNSKPTLNPSFYLLINSPFFLTEL